MAFLSLTWAFCASFSRVVQELESLGQEPPRRIWPHLHKLVVPRQGSSILLALHIKHIFTRVIVQLSRVAAARHTRASGP
jgi:hypothetical protein